MKQWAYLLLFATAITACSKTEDQQASTLMERIQTLYSEGRYAETLDSIESLRAQFPKAIKTRRQALTIWQDASLKMAEADVLLTDSALQSTLIEIDQAKTLLEANRLRQKRDSLRARYDAMCGVVRMIHMRQKSNQE